MRAIPNSDITRYVFVNKRLNGYLGTATINGITTDAMCGILDFKTSTNALDNVVVYEYTTLKNNGTTIVPGGSEYSLKNVLSNKFLTVNTTVSTASGVTIKNITTNPPVILNVTSGQGICIKPETVIKAGSTAVMKIDATLK
jgi:hypothetical protein